MGKLPILYLAVVSALFLKTLTFIPEAKPYQFQSAALAQEISTPKWKKRYIELTKKARLLKKQEGVDHLICQTLTLARDLPSLRTHHFLEAKWKALHQLIATLYFYERQALTLEEVNGSEAKSCYRLKKGSKQWGFIKKRANLHFEQACWDLSLILKIDQIIAPSFPIELDGKPYVFQPFLPMRTYRTIFTFPHHLPKRITKISQIDYWKANLFMTLIGPQDLHAGNIGYTKNHSLVFFDNEHVFSPTNTFLNSSEKLTPPCMNHLLDWPQGKNPLTQKNAHLIQAFLKSWKQKKSQLQAYYEHPSVPNFLTETMYQALIDRFEKLTRLTIQNIGVTFISVIETLYPNLYDGLEELTPIVQQITKRSISPMSTLQFLTSHRLWWENIAKSDEQKMRLWVEKYHLDQKE